MKPSIFYRYYFFVIAGTVLFSGVPLAAQSSTAYTWNDGNRNHTIYIQPDQIADFSGSTTGITKNTADVQLIRRKGSVRIWKIKNTAMLRSLEKGIVPQAYRKFSSPVFSSNPGGGAVRALPGNVFVSFKSDWKRTQIELFSAKNNLEIISRLKLPGNIYLVKTNPGIDALNLANKLRGLPGVVASYPDWWLEVSFR